jgi:hypothetical protein
METTNCTNHTNVLKIEPQSSQRAQRKKYNVILNPSHPTKIFSHWDTENTEKNSKINTVYQNPSQPSKPIKPQGSQRKNLNFLDSIY